MKKLSMLLALLAVSGAVFAQDEAPKTWRSLSFYFDTFSGHLTGNPSSPGSPYLFLGNEFEFGATYSQNFAKAPWLSMWVKALVVTGIQPAYSGTGPDSNYLGNSGSVVLYPYGIPRVQLGLNFGGWAVLAVDTRGLIANENYYTVNFGAGGSLTFITILEFWLFPQQAALSTPPANEFDFGVNSSGRVTVVDLFALRVDYGISFGPGWRFNTKLAFRFGGFGTDLSAALFRQSFAIRWENQLIWSVTDKFYMWTQIRYHISGLVQPSGSANKPWHQVFLQAGLGYTFDFSGN